jgi:uncharacterized protein YqgC (DUF456 family)
MSNEPSSKTKVRILEDTLGATVGAAVGAGVATMVGLALPLILPLVPFGLIGGSLFGVAIKEFLLKRQTKHDASQTVKTE